MVGSPLGVNFFWVKGHQPELDWDKRLSTVKLAIMVKDNIQVEKLLQPKQENRKAMIWIIQHHHIMSFQYQMKQPPTESNANNAIKSEKPIVKNHTKKLRTKDPRWTTSLGMKQTIMPKALLLITRRTGYKHIPPEISTYRHTKSTTDALVEQIKEVFIKKRNETFNRFQFFRCRQKERESLKVFHSRMEKRAALWNWDHLEQSQVKSIFLQGMNNQQIQMDLLSEDRSPSETLNYALTRERRQANQLKINNSYSPINTDNPWFEKVQYIKRQNRGSISPTPQTEQIQNCRRCRNKFLPGHLNVCPAKNEACRICKKIGHLAKLPKLEMPPRPTYNPQSRRQQNNTVMQPKQRCIQLATKQTEQKIRNINEEEAADIQTVSEETIDPESTCYLREMMEDWQNVNFINSVNFTDEKVTEINKTGRGEFLIKTLTNNKQVYWLAAMRSPRSFTNTKTARKLLVNVKTTIH